MSERGMTDYFLKMSKGQALKNANGYFALPCKACKGGNLAKKAIKRSSNKKNNTVKKVTKTRKQKSIKDNGYVI